MAPGKRKSDLSPRQRALVETMQRVRFGRIEHLIVRDGDPVIERGATRVVRSIRFEGEGDPPPARDRDDAVLKASVVNLVHRLAEIDNGTVTVLRFGDGLPASMEIDDDAGDQPGIGAGSDRSPSRPPLRGAVAHVVERR